MDTNSLSQLFDNRGVRVALTSVLVLLALFLLVSTINTASNLGRSGQPATDTITVNGTGEATMIPDIAKISFTIQNTAATVPEANDKTNKQGNEVIAYLKQQGIKETDIRTLSYSVNPQYSYPNPCPPGSACPTYSGSPKITGYQAMHSIQVTIRDTKNAGTILAGLATHQVQNVSGPEFTLDDSNAGYLAARAKAIDDAKAQARQLADQLGVRLGKIVNFSESSGGYPRPMMYEAYGKGAATADSVATPSIQTGENTYNASVSVTYEIR